MVKYIPLAEAAKLLSKDISNMHKKVKEGLPATYKMQGKLKKWSVDIDSPEFQKLLAGDKAAKAELITDFDFIEWDLLCRTGDKRIVTRPCSDSTMKEYKRYLKNFFTTYKDLSHNNIRSALQEFQGDRDNDKLSSKHFLFRALMTAVKYYRYKGYVSEAFVKEMNYIRPPQSTNEPKRIFHTMETVHKVLESLKEAKNGREQRAFTEYDEKLNSVIIQLLPQIGVRRAELTDIRLQDIDWKAGEIKIFGKGGKKRPIGISLSVGQALKEYMRIRPNGDSEFLFLSKEGKPLRPDSIYRRLYRVSKYAQVEGFTPHSLRRTFARWANLEKSIPIGLLRDMLGHSSFRMTNIYLNTKGADVVSAMRGM